MPTSSVVQILTGSIAPVIVISGVGLVLLSISNRYGRALDRARALLKQIEQGDAANASAIRLDEQLHRTYRRAKLLRSSMMYGSASIFFVSLTILALFAEYILKVHSRLRRPAVFRALPVVPGGVAVLLHPRHHGFDGSAGAGDQQRAREPRLTAKIAVIRRSLP